MLHHSVHSWVHLCIDLDLETGLVNLTVNGKLAGDNIQIEDQNWSSGNNLTLSDVVLGENNNGKWNGDQGHRSLIGNINLFSSSGPSSRLQNFTLNPCQTEGDLLR